MFSIFVWQKGAGKRMEDNLSYETKFLLDIGIWLYENGYISIDEQIEYENIVKNATKKS